MSKVKNVIGEKYNRFTIIEMLPAKKYGKQSHKFVKAICECGNIRDTDYRDLKRGRRKSCGCINAEIKIKVKEGQQFTHWTVLKETEGYFDKKGEKADRTFLCKCICSKEKNVNLQSLLKEQSKSCGCQGRPKKEKIKKVKIIPEDTTEEQWKESYTFPGYYISTLGRLYSYKSQIYIKTDDRSYFEIQKNEKSKVKEMYLTFIGNYDEDYFYPYFDGNKILKNIKLREKNTDRVKRLSSIYSGMRKRCYNEKDRSYCIYGARGIKIAESFNSFIKFFNWAIENGYEDNLEIDRINSDKDYCESNCRFVTKEENNLSNKKINLTLEDVYWIRSDEFSYEEALHRFTCSYNVIRNIREYRTFKNVPLPLS